MMRFMFGLILAIVFTQCGKHELDCVDGCTVLEGSSGPAGSPGPQGPAGAQGPAGQDGKDAVDIPGKDGKDGTDGLPGKDGTQISIVIPCGRLSGSYPEVMLCIDGNLFAVYNDSGTTTRYVEVPPGYYRTTDGRGCYFTVVEGCTIE